MMPLPILLAAVFLDTENSSIFFVQNRSRERFPPTAALMFVKFKQNLCVQYFFKIFANVIVFAQSWEVLTLENTIEPPCRFETILKCHEWYLCQISRQRPGQKWEEGNESS